MLAFDHNTSVRFKCSMVTHLKQDNNSNIKTRHDLTFSTEKKPKLEQLQAVLLLYDVEMIPSKQNSDIFTPKCNNCKQMGL